LIPIMARKQATSAEVTPEMAPERLQSQEIAPVELAQGMAIVRQQSDVKDAAEMPAAHPMPPGPDEYEEVDRMLASAGTVEEMRTLFRRELPKQKALGATEGGRAFFWLMETLALPRASIVGRHLHDHGITENKKHVHVHGFEVYHDIHKRAQQHLSEAAKKHVKCSLAPANLKESKAAASYFIKDLRRRIKLLADRGLLQQEGDQFWLNAVGARVFHRWPWWSSRDDDDEPRLDSEPLHPSNPGERKPS